MHRFRFLIMALAGLFVALSALVALATDVIPKVCSIELRDGFARIVDAPCALNPKDVAALSRSNAAPQLAQPQLVELGNPRPAPLPACLITDTGTVLARWGVPCEHDGRWYGGASASIPREAVARSPMAAARALSHGAGPHLQLVAEADPNPRFIPLCSALGEHPGSVECIPDESVAKYQETRLWTYAARQLPKCSIVVLNPDGPFVAENLGYRCDGVITGGGILPDDDAEE